MYSQYLPAELRQAPAGSTIWVCTSKMNSSPASASAPAAVSNALSLGKRKRPPMLPSAAKASFNVSKVVAAPQSDCRNARRPIPTRFAFSPIRNSASRLARATCSVSGTGRNSPLEVASTFIGSGPLSSSSMTVPLYIGRMFTALSRRCRIYTADPESLPRQCAILGAAILVVRLIRQASVVQVSVRE